MLERHASVRTRIQMSSPGLTVESTTASPRAARISEVTDSRKESVATEEDVSACDNGFTSTFGLGGSLE